MDNNHTDANYHVYQYQNASFQSHGVGIAEEEGKRLPSICMTQNTRQTGQNTLLPRFPFREIPKGHTRTLFWLENDDSRSAVQCFLS